MVMRELAPFRRKAERSERARSATKGMAFLGMALRPPTAHPPPRVPNGTLGDPFLRKG